jgi:hypothetical protein
VRVSARAYRNLKRAMRGLPPLKRRGFGQPGVQAKTNHGGNGHTLSRQRWEDFTARRREEWRKHGTNLVGNH